MSLTLLLDLDDTCLGNSMDTFIPAYLQALGEHLAAFISPQELIPALLSSTQEMLKNHVPDRTLKQVFDQAFYPRLGINPQDFTGLFNSFYTEKFPSLKNLTQYRPEAVNMVDEAFNRGYRVAIATNPLFPYSAILQRLEWAGLSPSQYDFSLIPSYETSYFSKPNPAFFTETLSLLGWPEGQVVMVGDDYDNDIAPARKLGIGTFWITNGKQPKSIDFDDSNGYGDIQELLSWIDSIPSELLLPDFSHVKAMLAVLRASPAVLNALSKDLDASSWIEHPQPGEWSFTEILCHLRDVDIDVNLPRIDIVLNELNPFLPGIDSDKWAEERLYYCQNGTEALRDYTSSRIQLLDILDGLKPEDWQRPARHAIFGPTSLKELVSIIVGHDRLHVQQAFRSLNDISLQTLRKTSSLN
jgi:HAD superfamily hydrolase (TIGR01549 family)